MSENIKSHFVKFGQRHTGAFTNVEGNGDLSDEADSKEAHKSEQTKKSEANKAVVTVSQTIVLQETSRSIQTFNLVYDRLFRQFQENLINEYANMRSTYMSEYQTNFNQNSSRRDDRISEMNLALESQDNYI